jgi:hypothetical protein
MSISYGYRIPRLEHIRALGGLKKRNVTKHIVLSLLARTKHYMMSDTLTNYLLAAIYCANSGKPPPPPLHCLNKSADKEDMHSLVLFVGSFVTNPIIKRVERRHWCCNNWDCGWLLQLRKFMYVILQVQPDKLVAVAVKD